MPNNFQPHIPDFQRGERLSAARLNELADAIARIMWQKQKAANSTFGVEQPLNQQAILLEDLLAAVNKKRDPSTAQAAILLRKTNGDLTQTSRTVTVVNRFENVSIDAGTYIKIEWIDGEWQPYAADCPSADSGSV